jgi:hypothetical protein
MFITVSLRNNFSTIKQNGHYCVNIRLLFGYVGITLHVSIFLFGHLQAYAIQVLVTEINMNSYCVHDWFKHFLIILIYLKYNVHVVSICNLQFINKYMLSELFIFTSVDSRRLSNTRFLLILHLILKKIQSTIVSRALVRYPSRIFRNV